MPTVARNILALSALCATLAGCEGPSEPTRAEELGKVPDGSSALVAHRVPLGRHSTASATYDVPPGAHVLQFTIPGDPLFLPLAFSFTGRGQVLRVNRVADVGGCGVDIEFADATLLDATRFFAYNPMPGWSNVFDLTVENLSDTTVPLRVTARYVEVGGNPPCPS